MNLPLRSFSDMEAIIEGVCDGTIDMIATDHAPHSAEEKSRGLEHSAMGVVGLETAFPLLFSGLVLSRILPFRRLMELLHDAPCRRFGLDGGIEIGDRADLTVFDISQSYRIDPEEFVSMGKSTPFTGLHVCGRCRMTLSAGKIAWSDGTLEGNS